MLHDAVKFLKLHVLNRSDREEVARRHLMGGGIEIGAMHFPLPVPPEIRVRYVDLHSKAENVARCPEIDGAKVVEPDFVEDGFTLPSFADGSEDFVIANHVLEHSNNPIGTLQNWSRVLKRDGILFLTVPNKNRCFDKGRSLTTLEHLLMDASDANGHPEAFRRRNSEHYQQWVEISLPAAARSNPSIQIPAEQDKAAWTQRLEASGGDIHFHTFDYSMFKRMLEHYCSHIDASMQIVRIYRSAKNFEFIAVMRKLRLEG